MNGKREERNHAVTFSPQCLTGGLFQNAKSVSERGALRQCRYRSQDILTSFGKKSPPPLSWALVAG